MRRGLVVELRILIVVGITRCNPITRREPWRLNDALEGFRSVGFTLAVPLSELQLCLSVQQKAAGFWQNYFLHAHAGQLNEIITRLGKQQRIRCAGDFVALPIICIANICALLPN